MLENLLCRQSLLWIVGEELLHQVDGLWWCVWNQLSQGLPLDAWCLLLHVLEVLLTLDLLLDRLIRKSKELDKVLEVLFSGAGANEDLLGEELSDGAAHGPHVDRSIII